MGVELGIVGTVKGGIGSEIVGSFSTILIIIFPLLINPTPNIMLAINIPSINTSCNGKWVGEGGDDTTGQGSLRASLDKRR